MGLLIRDDRQMKALTGVSQAQCDFLLPAFSHVYQETQQHRYEDGVKAGNRSRKPGAGIQGKLPTMADTLLFVLYYYKTYPTCDVLGAQFDMVRSKANEHLHKLSPILYDTLKNTVMSMPDKWMVFLGRTFSGHNHDYSLLKQEWPPALDWFRDVEVWVDLGYQGIRSDYDGDLIEMPHKKPPTSTTNPHPELTAAQRAENQAVSQVRIFVEHAIGGMKRFNILVQRFRNRKENVEDDSIGICAGLWNLNLCY